MPYVGQNGGVVVFSKYPITFANTFHYNKTDEIMLRKGFAVAMVEIPNSDNNNVQKLCCG